LKVFDGVPPPYDKVNWLDIFGNFTLQRFYWMLFLVGETNGGPFSFEGDTIETRAKGNTEAHCWWFNCIFLWIIPSVYWYLFFYSFVCWADFHMRLAGSIRFVILTLVLVTLFNSSLISYLSCVCLGCGKDTGREAQS
jgi:hypothetical protein